jgi:hypothetical protein
MAWKQAFCRMYRMLHTSLQLMTVRVGCCRAGDKLIDVWLPMIAAGSDAFLSVWQNSQACNADSGKIHKLIMLTMPND